MHDQVPVRESGQPPRGGGSIRRVMIMTIIVLVLLVVSFAAGRLTKSGASASPTRTITVTAPPKTVTATPTTTVSASSQPSPSPAATGSAPPAGTNSALAGSYSVKIPIDYTTPLGVSPPKQSQFNTNGNGDLTDNDGALYPGSLDQMLYLAPATTPTYKICTADTVYMGDVEPVNKGAFCLKEPGYILGIAITSVSSNPSYVAMRVWVWKDA